MKSPKVYVVNGRVIQVTVDSSETFDKKQSDELHAIIERFLTNDECPYSLRGDHVFVEKSTKKWSLANKYSFSKDGQSLLPSQEKLVLKVSKIQ